MSASPLPAHDAPVGTGPLTSIVLNQEWRAIITGALESYWATYPDSLTTIDNLDKFNEFLNDLYN